MIFIYLTLSYEFFNPININTPLSFNENNYFKLIIDDNTKINYNNKIDNVSIFDNRINLTPIIKNYNTIESNKQKCCYVQKQLSDDNFKYDFKVYDNCDIDDFELDHNNQLFIDGLNGWSNSKCTNDNNILGSCKHLDFECIDFVSKKTCDMYNDKMPLDPLHRKINFTWSPKPCYAR